MTSSMHAFSCPASNSFLNTYLFYRRHFFLYSNDLFISTLASILHYVCLSILSYDLNILEFFFLHVCSLFISSVSLSISKEDYTLFNLFLLCDLILYSITIKCLNFIISLMIYYVQFFLYND